MKNQQATRWCPTCRAATVNAPVPQLSEDLEMLVRLPSAGDHPRAFRRQLYCVNCTTIWHTLELPQEYVEQLCDARSALEESKRQIAMLRFLLAQQRQVDAREIPDTSVTRHPLRLVA